MSWNRKTKLVFSSLRSGAHPPRIFLESLFSNAFSPIHRHGSSISSAKFSGFSSISLLRTGLGICSCSPFLTDPKRFYYVDRYQVRHFKPRGPRRWFRNPRTASTVAIVSSGVLITVYFANLETVPCTNRRHFVLLSKSLERRIGEAQFQQIKAGFKGEILPAIHPDSIRVRLIAADIIDALQRGFSHEGMWSDIGYASMDDDGSSMDSDRAVKGTVMAASKEGKIMDNRWIQQWRKKGKEKGSQAKISHLEGLNWEVLVVNKPVVNAFCLPSGKIVLFTGLLDHFEADSEIATVIGHEVGHVVARHIAEEITKNLWFVILQLVLYQLVIPDIANTMSAFFLRLPFSRKMEIEADYIGLLLLASAGYDPRVAPGVYEELGNLAGDPSPLTEFLSTHPSGKRRAQLLAEANVMEEALMIYRQVGSGRAIEDFL